MKKQMFQKGYYWISIVEEKKKVDIASCLFCHKLGWVYKKNEFET
jgi:hypothetical protein